jgi:hypothetical protein
MGTAGSPYGEFQTALRTGSFGLACNIARSLPRISLADALRLTLLAAHKEPHSYQPMARRWLARFLLDGQPTLDELAWAAALFSMVARGDVADETATTILTALS